MEEAMKVYDSFLQKLVEWKKRLFSDLPESVWKLAIRHKSVEMLGSLVRLRIQS